MLIYSIRDALGAELWWTTHRASAVRLAAELTQVGDAVRFSPARAGAWVLRGADCVHGAPADGLREHQFPVAIYKVTEIKTKGAPHG